MILQYLFHRKLFLILAGAVLLAACSTAIEAPPAVLSEPAAEPAGLLGEEAAVQAAEEAPGEVETSPPAQPLLWGELETQVDQKGAIGVSVTPINLDAGANTIDFEIVMDTHSVDLSMDLSALAALETETGETVQADIWDAPLGGHHVSGTLSFPAVNLDEVNEFKLILYGLDGKDRIFIWQRQ